MVRSVGILEYNRYSEISPVLVGSKKKKRGVTFVDTSKAAHCAVSYLRTEYEDDRVSCRLIAAKSKVAPLDPTTIPRLELMAAVLGLRLVQSIQKVLSLPIKETSFSNSED